MNRQPKNLVITEEMEKCRRMAQTILDASDTRIGRIMGEPGTGKTVTGKWLAEITGGVRMCCSVNITECGLWHRLAQALDQPTDGRRFTLIDRVADEVSGRLVIIDEAAHLRWQHLEALRYLSDEAYAGLLLLGTKLLNNTFRDKRTVVNLAQFARRIGGKSEYMHAFSKPEELVGYVLQPRFGKVSRAVADAFYRGCQGYWGEANELADICQRIMDEADENSLSTEIIKAAAVGLLDRNSVLAFQEGPKEPIYLARRSKLHPDGLVI